MHRAPSSPALSRLESEYLDEGRSPGGGGAGRESLAELWQGFLEQESGSGSGGGKSTEAGTGLGFTSPTLGAQLGQRKP